MHGVVSLLDKEHWQRVDALWAEQREEFGLRTIPVVPFPHFSYHVAADYLTPAIAATLHGFAASVAPFRVQTNGLGLFTGANPVLFVPVVQSPELNRLHHDLCHAVDVTAAGSAAYYQPSRWSPHVTLASRELGPEVLARIVGAWVERRFDWHIPLDNLVLTWDLGTRHELRGRFPLGSDTAPRAARS